MDGGRPAVLTTLATLALSATVGATGRYYMTLWATTQWGDRFPYGTLLVNVLGSLILGSFLGLNMDNSEPDPLLRLLVATGFCGSFTTFSTFSYDTVRLLAGGHVVSAAINIVGSVVLGLLAVMLGAQVTRYLFG